MASIGHPEYRWGPGIPDERGVSHDFMLYQGPSTRLYLRVEECEAARRAYINCLPSFIYQETDEGPIGASAQQCVRLAEKANSIVRSKSTLKSNWYDFYDTMMPPGVVCKEAVTHTGFVTSAAGKITGRLFKDEIARELSKPGKYKILYPGYKYKRIAVTPEKMQKAIQEASVMAWEEWSQYDPKFRATNPSFEEIRSKVEEEINYGYFTGKKVTVDDFVAAMSKYMGEKLKSYKATVPGRLKQAVWDNISEYAAKETKIDLEAVSGYFLPDQFKQFCVYAAGIILEYMGYSKGVKNQEAFWVPHSAPMTILTSVDLTNWYAGR